MVGAGQLQSSTNVTVASERWEPWIRQFEAVWQEGGSPSIDAFVPADEPARQAVLAELVHIDLEMRLKRGEPVRVEYYLARYPSLASDPTVVVELLADEFRVRRRGQRDLPAGELFGRFPEIEKQLRERFSADTEVGSHDRSTPSPSPASQETGIAAGRMESVPLDGLVKQLADSGIIAASTLDNFVPPRFHPQSVSELIGELVKQKQLTQFQAQRIAAGRMDSLILTGYTILDRIGAGGMGEVFKAEHRRMKRLVAIKTLPAETMRDPAIVARFQREVEAAAKVRHPNIVAADDADVSNGLHFLVMEYINGSDLAAVVNESGPLPVATAIDYTLQAARGLQFAHEEGIVHRDIKPANLLVDKKGTVKILDMGLARIVGWSGADGTDLTRTGSVMGTVDYMAPEQARSAKHADARADIYSLGCSLYFLLTGNPPYKGKSTTARAVAHLVAAVPDLCDARPEVPKSLAAVFCRMVAKQVDDRYQRMSEVIAALVALQS